MKCDLKFTISASMQTMMSPRAAKRDFQMAAPLPETLASGKCAVVRRKHPRAGGPGFFGRGIGRKAVHHDDLVDQGNILHQIFFGAGDDAADGQGLIKRGNNDAYNVVFVAKFFFTNSSKRQKIAVVKLKHSRK
jgi:hypothetical protein